MEIFSSDLSLKNGPFLLSVNKINYFFLFSGYTGQFCEEEVTDTCSLFPCTHNATCIQMEQGNYTCMCPHGYEGPNCQTRISSCKGKPCVNGICQERKDGDGYNCYCIPGKWLQDVCACVLCVCVCVCVCVFMELSS